MTVATLANISAPRGFVQDGSYFFDSATGDLVAVYPDMVSHDYDLAGAESARSLFLSQHPDYSE